MTGGETFASLPAMDTLAPGTHIYTVQPGVPLAVAYQSLAAADITLAWKEDKQAAVLNTFKTASGEATANAAAADLSDGWLVIPPTNTVAITTTGNILVSVAPTQGHDLTDPQINAYPFTYALTLANATPLATPNTLVMRDEDGEAKLKGIQVELEAGKTFDVAVGGFSHFNANTSGGSIGNNTLTWSYNNGGPTNFYMTDNLSMASFRAALGSGTTGDALFVANTPAAALSALGVRQQFQTTDSAPRTSNTFTPSTEMQPLTLLAGVTYIIEAAFTFTSTSGAGIALRFNVPNIEGLFNYGTNGALNIMSGGNFLGVFNQTAAFGRATNHGRGIVRVTTNSTLTFEWATNVTNGTHNAFIHAGSFIRATPISGSI